MKSATAAYNTERAKLQTAPVYVVRFFHLKAFGDATDYAFRTQFASGTVAGATKTTLLYLGRIQGGTSAVQPEQGRASVGGFQVELVDVSGEMTRYLSAPALTLKTAMTAAVPGAGGFVEVNEATDGMPAEGTLEVTTGGVIERVRYDQRDDVNKKFRVATAGRGVDGTAAASHAIGDAVTNGEQIRPGQRMQLLAGYAAIGEADFMSFAKMEVVNRQLAADGVTWVIQVQDIQRTLRRQVFLTASTDAPVLFSGNPIDIALQVLTSTGTQQANGAYDLLPVENGLGVPQALVDVAGLESLRTTHFSGQVYRFKITQAADGKQWLEQNIWRSLNCYPVVTQDGKLTAKRFQPAPAPGSVTETLTETDLIGADWVAGDPMIVNQVLVQFDWDLPTAPDKFATSRLYTFDVSKTKFGPRPTLVLPLPGVRGDGSPSDASVLAIIDDRAFTIGKRFAEPPPALRCRAFYRNHLWEISDLLKLTYSQVPNLKTGKRGLTAEVFEIVDMTPRFPPAGGFLELTLLHTGAITVPPAPTAGPFVQAARRGVQNPAPTPGGLELVGQGNDDVYTGRDIRIRWNLVSQGPQPGIDEDNLASQENTIQGYVVVVKVGGVEKRRTAPLMVGEYEYTWERNVADNGASGARTVTFEVRARTVFGLDSDPAILTVTNHAPDMSAVTPILTAVPEGVLIDWSAFVEADVDFDHYEVKYGVSTPPATLFVSAPKGQKTVLLPNVSLGAGASLFVQITPFDAFGAGTASAIASRIRAPAAPTGLTASVKPGLIDLDWADNTETDLNEYGVYRNTVDNPSTATQIAQLRASRFVDASVVAGTAYFYWISAFSVSEVESAKSASASATAQGSASSDAPANPAAATKSAQGTYLASDGTALAFFDIALPAMPSGAAYMNLLYKPTAAAQYEIGGQVTAGSVTVRLDDLTTGRVYNVAVQAFSGGGGASAIVEATSSPFTAPGDTTPPAAPTAIAVRQSGAKIVEIDLTFTEPADWGTVELYRHTVDVSGSATLIDTGKKKRFHDENVSYGTTYFYWAKVVDLSGNKSGFSPSMSHSVVVVRILTDDVTDGSVTTPKISDGAITTLKLGDAQVTTQKLADGQVTTVKIGDAQVIAQKVADGAVTTAKIGDGQVTTQKLGDGQVTTVKFASGLRPVEVLGVLPAAGTAGRVVFLTTDNKLYRDTGVAWTVVVPTSDLSGTITETQITDGAISTPKLGANAVTAAKIAVGTITSTEIATDTIVAGNISAGAIGASELAAGAVVAGKIAAGTIVAGDIATGTITANEIAALTITAAKIVAGAIETDKLAVGGVTTTTIAGNAATLHSETITAAELTGAQPKTLQSVAVTPATTSSVLEIFGEMNVRFFNTGFNNTTVEIQRDIGGGGFTTIRTLSLGGATADTADPYRVLTLTVLDSPASTATVTYRLRETAGGVKFSQRLLRVSERKR